MNVLSPGWGSPPPSGVAIGVFDGVHVGHARVVERLVDTSGVRGLQAGVLTFDPHPVEVLAPGRKPELLTPLDRRRELLLELGVDWIGVLDLRDIRTMTPDEFIDEVLVERASCRQVFVGQDFRFGHDRAGDVSLLREVGPERGFEVATIDLVTTDDFVISSSRIRALLKSGEVGPAADLLGRPHRVTGQVIEGDARGRDLGYPTANMVPPVGIAIPADGIYAVRVEGTISRDGVASLGIRPTFGDHGPRLLEVHLFDFNGDLYGATLHVDFIHRLRDEKHFDSVDALIAQMERDAAGARRALAR